MVVYPAADLNSSSIKEGVAKIHGKEFTREQLFVWIQEELLETKNIIILGRHYLPLELLHERLLYRYSLVSELIAHLSELTSR